MYHKNVIWATFIGRQASKHALSVLSVLRRALKTVKLEKLKLLLQYYIKPKFYYVIEACSLWLRKE